MCPSDTAGPRDATWYMKDMEDPAAREHCWQNLLQNRLSADLNCTCLRARHPNLFHGPLFGSPADLCSGKELDIDLVEQKLALIGLLCDDYVYYSRFEGSDQAILLRVNRDVFEAWGHPWIAVVIPAAAEEGAAFEASEVLTRCGAALDRMCFLDAGSGGGKYRLAPLMMAAIHGDVQHGRGAGKDQQRHDDDSGSVYARMHVPSWTRGHLISKFL